LKRRAPWLLATVLLAGMCWAFPPIRVHSLKSIRESQAGTPGVAAKDSIETFWSRQLLPAAEHATDAAAVVHLVAADPKQVRERFGRTVGVSSSYFLFLRGAGRVVAADDESIALSLKPTGDEPDVVVPLGFVFGNAVRDATGLVSSSSYPNAQAFNEVSAKLNEIVEKRVLPEFQRVATVGRRVRFVGCVEVADEETDLKPLKLVPVDVGVQ
jgi:predicted lipoprotein